MTDTKRNRPIAFPRSLAEGIARKAHTMAERLENEAISRMVQTAKSALARGETPQQIAREMAL